MAQVYVYPREFQQCVEHLCWKLREIAGRGGVSVEERCDLESALAALPPQARSHAKAMLNGIQLSAADDFPAMAFAASYVLKLAREIWDAAPGSRSDIPDTPSIAATTRSR